MVLNVAMFEKCSPTNLRLDIVRMMDEYDVSDLDDILSESEELIPQRDACEARESLEVYSEESDIANLNSDEDAFIVKSRRKWTFSAHVGTLLPI